MTNILEQVAHERGTFVPRTPQEFVALALARFLGDVDRLRFYVKLAQDYSPLVLTDAARRFARAGTLSGSVMVSFVHELTHGAFTGSGRSPEIVAIKIERTAIGMAAFGGLGGLRLLRTEVKHLRSVDEDAERTTAAMIRQVAEDYPNASIALEACDQDTRRGHQYQTALGALRELGLPLWTFETATLLDAFALPSCPTRKEMRSIVRAIHSDLSPETTSSVELDAVALGMVTHSSILLPLDARRKDAA